MSEATLIYPHQLFKAHPAITAGRPIYLVEEPLLLTEFPIHRQKLLFHRLSMRAYYESLVARGHHATYLEISNLGSTEAVFERIHKDGIRSVHVVDVTDDWLTKRINAACTHHAITLHVYKSPLFIVPKAEAMRRYQSSKKHLAKFYQTLRLDKKILITDTLEPVGGQWSFDSENRRKLPKNMPIPLDPLPFDNADVAAARRWLEAVKAEQYGEATPWLPYAHREAETWFKKFLTELFENFGMYEDAISTSHTRLFHSALSPLLNVGLLTPQFVLDEALHYAKTHNVPINSLEGFVRQILGWREFIRAAYECDGVTMRTKNFWLHTKPLPHTFWTGKTGLPPVDTAIASALTFGYNHHIERLMVLGNIMLLRQTNPDEVYRWFMAMYVDAYDWVMVPNVYGMSQFADGGLFATKPYISGSNYIRKMSDHQPGDWEDIWTALYWNFIGTHQKFFSSNHRLSMMPTLLARMDPEKKKRYRTIAHAYLEKDTRPNR